MLSAAGEAVFKVPNLIGYFDVIQDRPPGPNVALVELALLRSLAISNHSLEFRMFKNFSVSLMFLAAAACSTGNSPAPSGVQSSGDQTGNQCSLEILDHKITDLNLVQKLSSMLSGATLSGVTKFGDSDLPQSLSCDDVSCTFTNTATSTSCGYSSIAGESIADAENSLAAKLLALMASDADVIHSSETFPAIGSYSPQQPYYDSMQVYQNPAQTHAFSCVRSYEPEFDTHCKSVGHGTCHYKILGYPTYKIECNI